jgi:anti-sigma B factor antagonist
VSVTAVKTHSFSSTICNGDLEIAIDELTTNSCRLRAVGDLDFHTAALLRCIVDLQHEAGRNVVRLDLSDLSFLDAAGLGVLVESHRDLVERRGGLTLTGISPRFRRLLKITNLDKTFPDVDDS